MRNLKHRILVTLGAILVLSVYFSLAWWLMMWEPKPKIPEWTPAEKKYVIQRMKHHGISSCIHDESGYYFMRDGKRCRL